jgi:Pyridoxal-dependent decarboxylase, C-terminal sheet domain
VNCDLANATRRQLYSPSRTAAVDGGMTDNMRVALYGAEYEVLAPGRPYAREKPVTVVGKHCESGDVLAADVMLPEDLGVGDVVCSLVTGAYGYSMASSYNRLGRPAVVFASGHRTLLMLRRPRGDGNTEFTMVTCWNDMESIVAFAGPDPERAVFYPRDEQFLVDRDLTVRHYEVYGSYGLTG